MSDRYNSSYMRGSDILNDPRTQLNQVHSELSNLASFLQPEVEFSEELT